MLKDNLAYLRHAINHPEPHLDENYMFVEREIELEQYIIQTKAIKELLTTIKKMLEHDEKPQTIEKYFQKLFQLFKTKYNASELRNFIPACDTSFNVVLNNYEIFKEITHLYFQKRDLNDLVPGSWIQAIIDSHCTRKQGNKGELKLQKILESRGYKKVDSFYELNVLSKCFAFYKKPFTVRSIDEKFNLNLEADFKEGKKLDILFKNRRLIFLLEAKHLNTLQGGAQSKQINELIDLVKLRYKKVHLISFLDGGGSNQLLSPKNNPNRSLLKVNRQREDIINALKINKNNFWLNTESFKLLIQDLA